MLTYALGVIGTVLVLGVLNGRFRRDAAIGQLRALRTALDAGELELRVATETDGVLAWFMRDTPDRAALVDRGFRVLGVFVSELAGQRLGGAFQVLVDAPGSTCASLHMTEDHHVGRVAPILELESFRSDAQHVTRRANAQPSLARPPTHHDELVPKSTSLEDTLSRHRAFADHDDGARSRVATIEDYLEHARRCRARGASWRRAQSPEVILEADLRSLLGDRYDRLGKSVAKRLLAPIPAARLRKRG